VTKPRIVKHGSIHMNDREFSDIKIVERSRKGISLFMLILWY
jgi:Fe-S cluster assembly ATPase SufC